MSLSINKTVPLSHAHVESALEYVPQFVREQLAESGAVLAGGAIRDAIRGDKPKDLDIFCRSREQAYALADAFQQDRFGAMSATPKRSTFAFTVDNRMDGRSLPVQYVFYKEFTDAEDLVSQFDFRACCAGVYWDTAEARFVGVAVPGMEDDCLAGWLEFMEQPKDAGNLTALGRVVRLLRKGWDTDDRTLARILKHWRPELSHEDTVKALKPAYGGPRG